MCRGVSMLSLKKELTPDELIRLHIEENMSLTEIGKLFHVSRQRVHQIKKEYERKMGKISRRVFIDAFTLKHHLEQGWSAKTIAEYYEIKPSQVTRMIRKYHKEYEDGHSLVEVKILQADDLISKEELVQLYLEELHTDKEIAEKYQVSASTVNLLRKKYDIPTIRTKSLRKLPNELPKELFERLYLKEKWTLDELAKHYKCNVVSIIRLKPHCIYNAWLIHLMSIFLLNINYKEKTL